MADSMAGKDDLGRETNMPGRQSLVRSLIRKGRGGWVVVAHAFNPSPREAEAGGSL